MWEKIGDSLKELVKTKSLQFWAVVFFTISMLYLIFVDTLIDRVLEAWKVDLAVVVLISTGIILMLLSIEKIFKIVRNEYRLKELKLECNAAIQKSVLEPKGQMWRFLANFYSEERNEFNQVSLFDFNTRDYAIAEIALIHGVLSYIPKQHFGGKISYTLSDNALCCLNNELSQIYTWVYLEHSLVGIIIE